MSYSASCCSDFLLQQKYDSHSLIKSPLICWRVVLALSFCPLNFTLPANKTSKLTVNLSVCLFPLELHKDVDLSHKSAETLRVFRFSLMLWCENIVCIYALVMFNETILLQFSSPQTRLEISWRLSLKISSCFTLTNTEVQSWTLVTGFSLWLHHHLLRLPQWRSGHKRFVEMTVWYTEYEQMWTCHWFVLMSTCCPGDGADGKSTAAG